MPLSIDDLAANPYRTLGLPACASQADIDNAARRLRIFVDPAEIPATPFDFPALGKLARTRPDIESAVATLADPAFRLHARLRWYNAPPGAPLPDNPAAPPAERLDNAVAALHATLLHDPRALQTARWHDLLLRFQALANDHDLPDWLAASERAADFEKPASPGEILDALIHLPNAILDALVARAIDAVTDSDLLACHSILAALTAPDLHLPGSPSPDAIAPILDRIEDTLDSRSAALDAHLRDKLRTRHEDPAPYYAANLAIATDASKTYDSTIRPLLALLESSSLPDRVARVRNRQAPLLQLLALGWEWAGRFILCQEIYQRALEHAAGCPYEARILADLVRIQPLAAKARAAAEAAEAARQRLAASLPTLHPVPKILTQPVTTLPAASAPAAAAARPVLPARPRPTRDRIMMALFLILAAVAILVAGVTIVYLLLSANKSALVQTPIAPPAPFSFAPPDSPAAPDPGSLIDTFHPTPLPGPTTPPQPAHPLTETNREP